jgi:hypothetical protein
MSDNDSHAAGVTNETGYTASGGTHEEDVLFLLSGLFDTEDGSSNSGEDLSSILNDMPEDFMNPISLF